MYLIDYYFAENNGGTINCNSENCTNWLNTTLRYQWTINRYGTFMSKYDVWAVGVDGYAGFGNLNYNEKAVHPVFYLASDIIISVKWNIK